MRLRLVPGGEKTRRLDHDIDPHLLPGQPGRVLLGKDLYFSAVDHNRTVFCPDISLVDSVHGIIFEKMG